MFLTYFFIKLQTLSNFHHMHGLLVEVGQTSNMMAHDASLVVESFQRADDSNVSIFHRRNVVVLSLNAS